VKVLTSADSFRRGDQIAYIVKRPDPRLKVQKDEVPRVGEVVMMNGKRCVVWNAYPMGDSEFAYWPDILVVTKDTP
jgi:hypothetical protein